MTVDSPPDAPLLFDPAGLHEGGRNVLLVSGKVVFLTEEEFQQALAATEPPPVEEEQRGPHAFEGTPVE
jgi:hypothetical protein